MLWAFSIAARACLRSSSARALYSLKALLSPELRASCAAVSRMLAPSLNLVPVLYSSSACSLRVGEGGREGGSRKQRQFVCSWELVAQLCLTGGYCADSIVCSLPAYSALCCALELQYRVEFWVRAVLSTCCAVKPHDEVYTNCCP
jgi:hypothetical protein